MDRTLNSTSAPSCRSTSVHHIQGRVDVDLRKTVEILRNSGVNVSVCNEEPPQKNPPIVGKGKVVQSKGKQSTLNVLAKGNGKALTFDPEPPSDWKENASTLDVATNKRQKTMGKPKEKLKKKEKHKNNVDPNQVISISNFAIGQQRRRDRERLEGRIRLPPISGLVPTKSAIAQRRRREIERNGIDHQASSEHTTDDLVSLSTKDPKTLDLTAQPNISLLPLCDLMPSPNIISRRRLRVAERNEIIAQRCQKEIEKNEIIAQVHQREIERNEIVTQSRRREMERNEIIAHSRRREIERNEVNVQMSSKQTNVDLMPSSMTGMETPDLQPNICEITSLTTHSEQNNLEGPSRRSVLGRILSPGNIGEELLNVEVTENETTIVHPATPQSVCLMPETTFISPPELSTTDLSTAIFYHRQTYLQLFLFLHLGMVTLGR